MAELGLMGFHIPKKYGGAELDMISYAMVIIELARADASVAITMAAHTSLGTLPLLLLGNKEQQKPQPNNPPPTPFHRVGTTVP